MILFTQKSRPNARITKYNAREEGKKHSMTRNKASTSTTIDNRDKAPTGKQASKGENRKQGVQLREFAVDQVHIIWD